MLADRYDLPLSTAYTAARDAYVEGCDLALTLYPGAVEAFDRALAFDPGFALAQAGKAQVLMREGNVAVARSAPAAAKGMATGLSAREASHIAFFDLTFAGRTDAAIAALHAHLTAWPRDALVLASAANPNSVIGASGCIGQKHQIAVLMDSLAPYYGDDWWFLAYHAMALSEDGQLAAARPKIERSVAANPNNAHGAHGFAHVCYESGETDTARAYLSSWLATYPRDGFFHGHLSWHLSLCELQAGNWAEALRLYRKAITLDRQRRATTENVGYGSIFVAFRTRRTASDAAAWRAMYESMRTARCRDRAAGSPTCTSSCHFPSWAMRPRSILVPIRWRIWRARGATRPAPICRRCRAASRRSNAAIFPGRLRRLPHSPGKTNVGPTAAGNACSVVHPRCHLLGKEGRKPRVPAWLS